MKQLKILILAIIIPTATFAQTETVTIEECETDTIIDNCNNLLKYFIVENEETKRLFKLNAVDWATLNPSFAYEQKLSRSISFELEAKVFLRDYNTYKVDLITHQEENTSFYYSPISEFNLDFRYYYNQNKRVEKGKQANGLVGDYLFIGTGLGLGNSIINYNDPNYKYNNTKRYCAKTGYGVQRRIGNIGYIDLRLGLMGNYYNTLEEINIEDRYKLSAFLDIKIGFGFKSFKRSHK